MQTQTLPSRPLDLVGAALSALFAGAIVGATTNAVSGYVSADYFRRVMRWEDIESIYRAIIAQGIFEGLLFGAGYAVVVVLVFGLVSRGRCPYPMALKYLMGMIGGVYAGWMIGGLAGLGLASLSPEFFVHTFRVSPEEYHALLRFAWVGGSIKGVTLGALLSVIIGCIAFGARWRKHASVPVSEAE